MDRPPPVAVLPAPDPIREEFPTEWRVIRLNDGSTWFGLSEAQYQALVLWLEDATRYITATNDQLTYYRDGLAPKEGQ